MKTYFQTNNLAECCGCSACATVCPKNCIEFKINAEGFKYPVKDMDKCIDCGLCEKVCSFSDEYTCNNTQHPKAYAAYDSQNRVGSSSGGLFYTLAKHIIEDKHGWVYGASFEDKLQLKHIGVNTIKDLQKLRGSKYLQSDIGDTFRRIKQHISNGEYVLFVGTPCLVAGLKAYLKYKQSEYLLCADLICHGVPSQYVFDEHVKYLENKHQATLTSYQFRNNARWGVCEIVDFANPKIHKVLPSYDLSLYLYSFMRSYTYRESCYHCKFTKLQRQGDLTLADWWGVRLFFSLMDYRKGVSLLLVNNATGAKAWEQIKDRCVFEESNIDDASKYNWNLNHVSKRPVERDTIYQRIREEGYEKTMKDINPNSHSTLRTWIIRIRELEIVDDIIYYMRRLMVKMK